MGAINAFEGAVFPGAQSTIETSVDASDCLRLDTFEELVKDLQEEGTFPTTIRHGRAYSVATTMELATFCVIP